MSMELDIYYSPYCPRCRDAGDIVDQAMRILELDWAVRHRNVLEHIGTAVAAGVRITPALTLNGQLLAAGYLNPDDLARKLGDMLAQEQDQWA